MTLRETALILSTSKPDGLVLRNITCVRDQLSLPAGSNWISTSGRAALFRSRASSHCTQRAHTPEIAPSSPAAAPKKAATRVAVSQSHIPFFPTLRGMVARKLASVEVVA